MNITVKDVPLPPPFEPKEVTIRIDNEHEMRALIALAHTNVGVAQAVEAYIVHRPEVADVFGEPRLTCPAVETFQRKLGRAFAPYINLRIDVVPA